MKTKTAGFYWCITLLGAFIVQKLLGTFVFTDDLLLTLFPYDHHLADVSEFYNSVAAPFFRPFTLFFGMLGAAMYNYRLGHVLLEQEGAVTYLGSNITASFLCSLAGAALGFYALTFVSVGSVSLVVGGSLLSLALPLALLGAGWRYAAKRAYYTLMMDPLHVRRPRTSLRREDTLTCAFHGLFDWDNSVVRLTLSMLIFVGVGMLMTVLLTGPLSGFVQNVQSRILMMDENTLPSMLLKGALGLMSVGLPFMTVPAAGLAAVIYEFCFVRPLRKAVSPAVLLSAAPAVAVSTYALLLGLVAAGVYSTFWYIIVGGILTVIAMRSPAAAAFMAYRLYKTRNVRFEDSLALKLIALIGFSLPLLQLIGG